MKSHAMITTGDPNRLARYNMYNARGPGRKVGMYLCFMTTIMMNTVELSGKLNTIKTLQYHVFSYTAGLSK